MMNKVFISYSTLDSQIAFRIYYDLQRSGIKAYLYEREGEFGIDFRDEIYKVLDEVTYFCLIDSPNARISNWVQSECSYARSKSNIRKIIPCFISEGTNSKDNEIFIGHNELRGLDFSGVNRLDYREIYNQKIAELCRECGGGYSAWSEIPRDRDFEKELAVLSLSAEEKEFLRNDYSNFVFSINRSLSTALSRINNLIDDCQKLNVEICICYLAKGKIFADLNDDRGALKAFEELSLKFPDDPRTWAALSAAQYYVRQFVESLVSLDKAIEIVNANPLNQYEQQHLPELVVKRIHILMALGQYNEAQSYFGSKNDIIKDLPESLITEIKLGLLSENRFATTKYQTLRRIYNFRLNSNEINRLIGDLEFNIGYYFHQSDDLRSSADHYLIAHTVVPDSIQYVSQLALVYYAIRDPNINTILESGLRLHYLSSEDKYYYGLLKFLNGEVNEANNFYFESNMTYWSKYEDLFI